MSGLQGRHLLWSACLTRPEHCLYDKSLDIASCLACRGTLTCCSSARAECRGRVPSCGIAGASRGCGRECCWSHRCLRKMRKNAQSNSWRCFTRPEPRVTHGTILHENRPESLMAFFYATSKGHQILPQSGLERYFGRFYAI